MISTHALREEGDLALAASRPEQNIISIHALREEGDFAMPPTFRPPFPFLSTPSARRATIWPAGKASCGLHFHPCPPRGGRRVDKGLHVGFTGISIHALREEGDACWYCSSAHVRLFLSTPSVRRATLLPPTKALPLSAFLSTPSARRATPATLALPSLFVFLSTPSARRATRRGLVFCHVLLDFYPRPP